jgi:PAS domain S-box-containing protein
MLLASVTLLAGGLIEIRLTRDGTLGAIERTNFAIAESLSRLASHAGAGRGELDQFGAGDSHGALLAAWDDVRGAGAATRSFCVVDASGVIRVHSNDDGAIGASVGATVIDGPDGPRTIASMVGTGADYYGRATLLGDDAMVVGFADMADGGAVLVLTSQASIQAALLRATLPWLVLTGLAALVLTPLSALLLHNAYRTTRRDALRRVAELNALFETSAFGVALVDRDLRYLRINRRLAAIDGRDPEEMIGRTIAEMAPHVAERVSPVITEVFRTNEAETGVVVRLAAGEGERVFHANYLPLRAESGRVEVVASVVLDVTDLERAEDALGHSERLYRTIVEAAREGVWMLDGEDRTTFVSGRMEEILGRSADALLGQPCGAALPRAREESLVRALERCRAGSPSEATLAIERAGDELATARFSFAPLRDGAGRYAGAVVLATDLSDHAERERMLRLSEERFRALVATQGEFVVRCRRDGTLLFVNDAYCAQFGMTRESLIGSNFFDLIPESDRASVRRKMESISVDNPTILDEHRAINADGTIGWQQWTDRGVFSADGELIEVVSVGRDITALRSAEERLREREQALALAQRVAGFGSWRWVIGEDRSHWSEGQCRLYGVTPDQHTPTYEGWLSLVHPDDRERCRAIVADTLEDRKPSVFEFDIVRPDGVRRTIQSAVEVIVDASGEPAELLGTSVDLTERRVTEGRLEVRTLALEKIAAGADLAETLETIALAVERLIPDSHCMVTGVDEDGRLRVLSAPNLPREYVEGVNGLRAEAGLASCPACVAEGRRVIASDTRAHPNWASLQSVVNAVGVGACWSEPIFDAGSKVIGSFSMSFAAPREPTRDDLETLRAVGQLAGIAISRLRAEEALAESEGRFRSLAETLNAVFWFAEGPPLVVRYVNPAFEAIWGRRAEDIYASPWLWNDSIHPDDRDRVRSAFASWLDGSGAEVYGEEYRIVRPDGEIRWIRDQGAVLAARSEGGARRVAGLAEDITAAKEAELQLQRLNGELRIQRNTLETVLGASSDLVFMYDRDGGFSYLNPAAERLIGSPIEAVRGKRVEELGQPIELYQGFIEQRTRVLELGVAEHGETCYPLKGEVREFDYVLNPVIDERGEIAGAVCSARDVTEQRRAAEQLRLALQQLTFHVDNTPLAIIEWDAEFRMRRWSRRAEELFGWTPEEMVGVTWDTSLVHPEDLDRVAETARRLLDREESRNVCVNRNLTRDGRVVHCEWYNSVLFDDHGDVVSVLSLGQDVTDRVRAEVALRASEERLRLALEASTDGIWDWDIGSGRILWSDRVFEIYGRSRGQGAPTFESLPATVHPDDLDRWRAALTTHLERDAPFDIEHRIVRPDGQSVWVRAVGKVVRDDAGRAVRMVGSVSDISERRKASEALQQAKSELERRVIERTRELVAAHDATARSEARFRSMFQNTGVGVVLAGADGSLVQANPAFERMVAPDSNGAPANGSADRRASEGWSRVLAACPAIRKVIADAGAVLQDEVQVVGGDSPLWLRLTAQSLVGGEGDEDMAVVIVEDITQRRRAEEIAKSRQNELAHAARLITVGELAAGLAHELNQPLAAISAYADGCARRLAADPGNPEALELLGKISGQSRRAGSIIHRLKDLVRKQAPRREQCRLDVMLQETLELVEPTAEHRGVAMSVRVPPDLPLVEADWVQLQQVFLNLLTNALEALGERPEDRRHISVEASHDATAGAVRVVVEDSGHGLNGVDPEQLFESFYSTKTKGMGLGLPISRSIMEAHDGRLWCEAGPSHGARFVLMIPTVRGEVAANG